MPPGIAGADLHIAGDPGVFGAVDGDAIGAPVRLAPAPERPHDAVAGADLEPGLDGLGDKALRRRQEYRREFAVLPLAVDDGRVVDRDVDFIRLRRGDHDRGSLLA